MARVKKNIVTEGLSGKLGNNIVFKQWGGQTIVSARPTPSEHKLSEGQIAAQHRFQLATRYAKQAIQDDTLKSAYQQRAKGGQNAYNVAMADYLNPPRIAELSTYTGAKGEKITLQAIDDHLVTDVQVAIYTRQGNLLEEGTAQLQPNGVDWVYTTQKANAQIKGSQLMIRASDLPGNITEKTAVFN